MSKMQGNPESILSSDLRRKGNSTSRSLASINGNETVTDQQQVEKKIRIGPRYQVILPEITPISERKPERLKNCELQLWSAQNHISDTDLENYISFARTKHSYQEEQALALLMWYKFDLKLAVHALKWFIPASDQWKPHDQFLFEEAFRSHGKNFSHIHNMIPHKSIGNLVEYYYLWKKSEGRNLNYRMRSNSGARSDWNNEETKKAICGFRKLGKDFTAISEYIGTKSWTNVRTFFYKNKDRYELTNILKEFRKEKALQITESNSNVNQQKVSHKNQTNSST